LTVPGSGDVPVERDFFSGIGTIWAEVPMAIFQCPVCELRFSLNSELEHHIQEAHPDFKVEHDTEEDELLASKKRRRREEGRRTP
jgi:hypothetical protein